jgi:hypothetical protein
MLSSLPGLQCQCHHCNLLCSKHILTKSQLSKWEGTCYLRKFPALHGTQTFTTLLIPACHWTISWARLIQLTPFYYSSSNSINTFTASIYLQIILQMPGLTAQVSRSDELHWGLPAMAVAIPAQYMENPILAGNVLKYYSPQPAQISQVVSSLWIST